MKEKKKSSWKVFWVAFFIVLVIGSILIFPRKTITCYRTEIKTEKEPYSVTEYYTEIVDGKNCNKVSGCRCLHYSWAGLGACDSCRCEKSREVIKYRNVPKEFQQPYNKQVNWLFGKC